MKSLIICKEKESTINYDYYHLKDKLELINLIEEYIQAIKTSKERIIVVHK